ncbi:hypothetical protein [uncultured Tyzzerella sp.]|uniref:hypothetical protein n=1 Tax=uncultured Tyzzerella sp. TaxID=2321398 RepID=UPI002942B230|nr:hypothetical protein [uncultured Tyzzerella sp.]
MIYYYVNSTSGIDSETSGSQETPFKTLEYCITQIHTRNIMQLNLEDEEEVLFMLNSNIEVLDNDAQKQREEHLAKAISRAYTDDVTVYLDKGNYELTSSNIYNGASDKALIVEGQGKDTIIKNSFTGNNSYFGTLGFIVEFRKFIWDNSGVSNSTVNNFLFNNNVAFENILFTNIQDDGYAWVGGGYGYWTIKNCVKNNFSTSFLRDDASGNQSSIAGSYGYFTLGYANPQHTIHENNKIITEQSTPLQLDEDYSITDPSVDTSKVGLYAGTYAWTKPLCLIKIDNKYYSINQEFYNNDTQNFNEVGSKDFEKSFDIALLTKQVTYNDNTFIPLEKFDNFSIVFQDNNIKKLNINGYKIENKTVITNPIDTRMVEYFNSIKINGNNVKCLLKFGDEEQYYSYNFDKNALENGEIDNIATIGIDISKIESINFNKIKKELEFTSITFAFYIQQDSIVNNVVIDYLEVGEFSQKDSYYTNLKVGYKRITIQPSFSASLVKINVL